MKNFSAVLLLLLSLNSAFGKGTPKGTFVEKDIFQTEYFLKNVPGLIPDYQGKAIRYYADHDGVVVFLTDEGPIYKLIQKDEKKLKELKAESIRESKTEEEKESLENFLPTRMSYTTVKWIGANPHPQIEATGKNSGYYSYLVGDKKEDLHSIVTGGFATLTYHDVYPGIDVVYTLPDKGGMKYNLIVHPGADVSHIQMEYNGDIKKLSKGRDGEIIVHTATGDVIEHAPASYLPDGKLISTSYDLRGNKVTFSLPDYDHSKTLVIDPWITVVSVLTVRNLGISVDYDGTGNAYVYGGGGDGIGDVTNYQKLAKYNTSGGLIWVFLGGVASISWSSAVGGQYNYLSNAKVDKITDKVYLGQGFNYNGTQLIRLTSGGVYDNFISAQYPDFREIWSFISDCSTGTILALGGGTNSNLNMGVINPTTGSVSTNNFTTVPSSCCQDIVSGAYDAFGNLYVVMASMGTPQVDNQMYKVNSTYNGYSWMAASGYLAFRESANMPAYDYNGSNNFNALAANSSYLYYYNGINLAAFNLTTGVAVGTAYTINGYNLITQGGIAVDNCNNVYVGGMGVIKTFSFNGITFTPAADIPLTGAFAGDTINDVRYDPANNLLYVTGSQIVGTYTATLSTNCTVVNTFTTQVTPSCSGTTIHVTPGAGLTNPVFSYVWQDSAGNVIRQTTPGTALNDTLLTNTAGHYTVQVQLNINCGGASYTDSFTVICNTILHTQDTTICSGQSALLSATGIPAGGTYLWTPGGATTSSITVSPTVNTTYYVTYTPLTGAPMSDSIHVTVTHSATVSVKDSTVICSGQRATLTATPSVGGGTYLWSPGGATTQSITVSPATTSMYTVTYNSNSTCGTATDSGLVVIAAAVTLTTGDITVCNGQSGTLTATPSVAGGTYLWSPGGGTTQSITVSPSTTSIYTVTYNTATCGSVVDSALVTVTAAPSVTVNDTTICSGQSAQLSATPSSAGGTYSWSPGSATSQSITITPASPTSYTVTYSVPGCSPVQGSGFVNFFNTPIINLLSQSPSCFGINDGYVSSFVQPQTIYTYNWSNNNSSAIDTALSAGTYTLTVTDPNGCTASSSTVVNPTPAATLVIHPSDTTVLQGNAIQLNSLFGGWPQSSITGYVWTPDTVLSCINCPNPMLSTGTMSDSFNIYKLTVTYNNGCVVTASDTIRLIFPAGLAIPSAFSPNGDGRNDTYVILARGVSDFSLNIYNRWGQLVFESTDVNAGWDGNYKGKQQPGGVYTFFFTIHFQNGKSESHTGTLTLLR